MPKFPFGDMGPHQLTWGYGESDAIVFNPVLGTVSVKQEDSVNPIEEEESGDTPVDAVTAGTKTTIEAAFTRSDWDQLELLLLGTKSGVSPNRVITVGWHSGCALYERSRPLLFTPLCDGIPSTDDESKILFYKTYPVRKIELNFNRGDQRVIKVEFQVFPSQDSGTVGLLYQVGI